MHSCMNHFFRQDELVVNQAYFLQTKFHLTLQKFNFVLISSKSLIPKVDFLFLSDSFDSLRLLPPTSDASSLGQPSSPFFVISKPSLFSCFLGKVPMCSGKFVFVSVYEKNT